MKKSTVSAFSIAAGLCLAGVAHADSVVGDFHTQYISHTSNNITTVVPTDIPSIGTVTFSLNGDGTIAASLNLNSSFNGILGGFAFNSPVSFLPESNFSDSNASRTGGFAGSFGTLSSGFQCPVGTPCGSNVTWTIGRNQGVFTSVRQALGGNGSVDFYVQTKYGDSYSAIAAVPESENYAMLLAGLGLMGVVASRRANKPAGVSTCLFFTARYPA